MRAAVAALGEWIANDADEPDGWVRTNYGVTTTRYRRRSEDGVIYEAN